MVAGASTIHVGLLIVAADDGIMPQTKEHFEILKLLDIQQGIIVLNKIDLVEKDWIDLLIEDIQKMTKNSFLENAIIIQTSTIQNIGIEKIMNHEKEVMEYGLDEIKKNNSVKIIGNPKEKGGVISFTIKGVHPHDIATILDEDGVAIRAGHHCCQILHEIIGVPATARASLGIYNTKEDIDILNKAIKNCQNIFKV